jgi:prenyl protein peptidase
MTMTIISSRGIIEPCRHRECDVQAAILYCTIISITYVGSLYVFVPSSIRVLPRDHPTQIQFRSLSCLIVCAGAIWSYPYLFCAEEEEDFDDESSSDDYSNNNENNLHANRTVFSIWKIIFFQFQNNKNHFLISIFGVLLHTCVIYVGPSLASLLQVYKIRKRSSVRESNNTFDMIRWHMLSIVPDSKEKFWIAMRNYIVAPLTEEIVFRGCIVPPLLASGMSPLKVSLVAPLFFGIAHVHHAMTRIFKGERLSSVVLITTFQFLYTSLFGSYVSYAFIRSGSILAITFSHSYCNWMGLPDLSFIKNNRHPLFQYRMIIFPTYVLGIVLFWYMFRIDLLLPLPPRLIDDVVIQISNNI